MHEKHPDHGHALSAEECFKDGGGSVRVRCKRFQSEGAVLEGRSQVEVRTLPWLYAARVVGRQYPRDEEHSSVYNT